MGDPTRLITHRDSTHQVPAKHPIVSAEANLRRSQIALEGQVEERTRELMVTNRELREMGLRYHAIFNATFQFIGQLSPDGTIIELATKGPGWTVDEAPDALGQSERIPPKSMEIANRDRDTIDAKTHPEPVPEITRNNSSVFTMSLETALI